MITACVPAVGTLHFDGSLMNGRHKGKMASEDRDRNRPGAIGEQPSERIPPDAFDRWLNKKLVLLYDPVLSEPIPEQIIGLIEAHRRGKNS